MDTALVVDGVVAQVWRGIAADALVAEQPSLASSTLVDVEEDGVVVCGQLYADGEFTSPPGADPTFTLTPFSTVAAALGSAVVDESLTLGATFNLIAGFRDVDVGRFWFFFEVPVTAEYHVVGSGIRLIEGDEYGFMIETVDQTGTAYDPPVFDVQVQSR